MTSNKSAFEVTPSPLTWSTRPPSQMGQLQLTTQMARSNTQTAGQMERRAFSTRKLTKKWAYRHQKEKMTFFATKQKTNRVHTQIIEYRFISIYLFFSGPLLNTYTHIYAKLDILHKNVKCQKVLFILIFWLCIHWLIFS